MVRLGLTVQLFGPRNGPCLLLASLKNWVSCRYCSIRYGSSVAHMPLETAAAAPKADVDPLVYMPPALRSAALPVHPPCFLLSAQVVPAAVMQPPRAWCPPFWNTCLLPSRLPLPLCLPRFLTLCMILSKLHCWGPHSSYTTCQVRHPRLPPTSCP